MASNKSGQTAFGAASARLMEQYEPVETRLFYDPVIRHLLSGWSVFLLSFRSMRRLMLKLFNLQTDGIFGAQVCRSRYIDEKTGTAIDNGIKQILILGAGLDTRPYRIKMNDAVRVFEIDLASVQQYKTEKIKQYYGALPKHVVYAPIDFNSEAIDDVLNANPFDFQQPTFIIWEGVTQYITPDAVKKTFDFISTLPSGSLLVFTYVLESVINKTSEIKGAKQLMEFFEKRNSAWTFGLEPVNLASFLKQYDLMLTEDVGALYYQQNYLKPIGRVLSVTEIERIAFVRVIKQS